MDGVVRKRWEYSWWLSMSDMWVNGRRLYRYKVLNCCQELLVWVPGWHDPHYSEHCCWRCHEKNKAPLVATIKASIATKKTSKKKWGLSFCRTSLLGIRSSAVWLACCIRILFRSLFGFFPKVFESWFHKVNDKRGGHWDKLEIESWQRGVGTPSSSDLKWRCWCPWNCQTNWPSLIFPNVCLIIAHRIFGQRWSQMIDDVSRHLIRLFLGTLFKHVEQFHNVSIVGIRWSTSQDLDSFSQIIAAAFQMRVAYFALRTTRRPSGERAALHCWISGTRPWERLCMKMHLDWKVETRVWDDILYPVRTRWTRWTATTSRLFNGRTLTSITRTLTVCYTPGFVERVCLRRCLFNRTFPRLFPHLLSVLERSNLLY